MASMDLSLDDIIQKKFSKTSSTRGRGRGQGKRLESGGRGQTRNTNRRTVLQGRRGGNITGSVSDARLKIIQNNRLKLTDARDKLAEIAKQTDARLKLDKLRENRNNAGPNLSRVGASITRRTGRNGQISLTTNKRRVPNNGNKMHERIITAGGRGFGLAVSKMDSQIGQGDMLSAGTSVLRRTVSNDRTNLPPPPLFAPPIQQRNIYTWVNSIPQDSPPSLDDYNTVSRSTVRTPILREPILSSPAARRGSTQPTSFKIIARNTPQSKHVPTLLSDREEWNYDAQSVKHGNVAPGSRIEPEESDEEESPPWRRGTGSGSTGVLAGRMSSELKARLDTPVVAPRTMGILSANSKSSANTAPTPAGHRIVVSNLQTSVTQEDIRELFEDIGPLVTSRLVRPGTAEVVYELHKDAVKAVDVYHNRQLDGQPMKCLLVNSRPPSVSNVARNSSGSRTAGGPSFKLPTGGKSSVIPDIGTIHKALFNKS